MTVPVPGQLVYSYDGDGATTTFSYPVRFLEKTEIVVVLRDGSTDTTQVLGSDYTIDGSSWPTGGNIVFGVAPASGKTVIIYRETTAKQTVDLENTQRNDANAVEAQLDRLAMVQQDQRQRIAGTWQARPGEGAGTIEAVPEGHLWVGDASGNLVDGGVKGTAANADVDDFASYADGELARSAVQPGDPEAVPTDGADGQVLIRDSAAPSGRAWVSKALGTGDMLSSAYDPANKQEQILTVGDIGESVATAAQGALADGAAQQAANGSDFVSKPDVRANIVTPTYVPDTAALKALDPSKDKVAQIVNNGQWVWLSGDYSAEAAIDTLSGIYAVSDSVAASVGIWTRAEALVNGYANVKWFGAKGDSINDDTAAVQAAMNTRKSVYVPAGKYRLTASITYNTSDKRRIYGDGKGVSMLAFEAGGLEIATTGFSPFNSLTIDNLTIGAKQAGGRAITVTRNQANSIENSITFRCLEIGGASSNPAERWDDGILLDGVRFTYFDDVKIWGRGKMVAGTGVKWVSDNSHPQYGLGWSGLWIGFFDKGLDISGRVEGVYGSGGEIWGCKMPVTIDADGTDLLGAIKISNMHFNGSRGAVKLVGAKNISLSNIHFFHGDTEEGVAQDADVLLIDGCSWVQVSNSLFSSTLGQGTVIANAVRIINASTDVTITGSSIIRYFDAGVLIESASKFINIVGNNFSGISSFNLPIAVKNVGGTAVKVANNSFENVGTRVSDSTLAASYDGMRTFIPTVIGSSVAGSGTYSTQQGRFILTDTTVEFWLQLQWSAHTGSGNLQVSLNALPVCNNNVSAPVAVYLANIAYTNQFEAFVNSNTNIINFRTVATDAAAVPIALDTGGQIVIYGKYLR